MSGTVRVVPVQVIQRLGRGPDRVLVWGGVEQGGYPGARGRGLKSRGRGDGQSGGGGDLADDGGAPRDPTRGRVGAPRFGRVITFVSAINFLNVTTGTYL